MKASDHLDALARGIQRWADFADCCLKGDGPAGVIRRGQSQRSSALRAEAASWCPTARSNPFDLVLLLAISRLELATRHSMATARLLAQEPMTTSASVVARAWLEASARALWLIDPSLSAHEMVGRSLADWLEEGKHLGRVRSATVSLGVNVADSEKGQGLSQPEVIEEVATQIGLDVRRDKVGKVIGVKGFPHLSTVDLLTKAGGDSASVLPMVANLMYRRSSAAAHGNFSAWGEAVGLTTDQGEPELTLVSVFAGSVVSTLNLHLRALRSWNSLIDWSPQDLMEQSERASQAPVILAGLEISQALRRTAPGNAPAPRS